jgi:regulator of sigma E protease
LVVTVIAAIAVLGVLILAHELGHYVAARMFDIRVPRFSIGLGPRVLGFQRGETEFRIGLLPLGGYVKMAGMEEMSLLEGRDEPEAEDPTRRFAVKSPAARAIVLSAGVFMNAVLAVVLFAVIAVVWGAPEPTEPVVADVVEEWVPEEAAALATIEPGSRLVRVAGHDVATMDDVARRLMRAPPGPVTLEFAARAPVTIEVPDNARRRRLLPIALSPIRDVPAVVGEVAEGGPADRAGLRPGDRIEAVGGRSVAGWQELARRVESSPGRPLALTVRRGDRSRTVTVTPVATGTEVGTVGRMGAGLDDRTAAQVPRERRGPVDAVGWGLSQSWSIVALMGDFVAGLIDGRYSPRELGGPLMIAEVSGAATRAGAPVLLFFVALLSINLAVINLLPIPALDGGHLAMLAVETIRGRPLPERAQAVLARAGVTVVVAIILWAVAADILRLVAP